MALARLISQGGSGLISLGANLLSRTCAHLVRSTNAGEAAKAQRRIEAISGIFRGRPAVPAVKALLSRHLGQPDWGNVRPPLHVLAGKERIALFQTFELCNDVAVPTRGTASKRNAILR
jgi:dihydrodipicolinate synthase/N-acetylneuraminate lyase